MRGLSLVVASGGHSSSRCAGLSLSRPLLLRSTSSRHAGSVIVVHGPSCSAVCGIFPDQGSNPCPPALAGRLSTTAPPGKPLSCYLLSPYDVLALSFFFFIEAWLQCNSAHLSAQLGELLTQEFPPPTLCDNHPGQDTEHSQRPRGPLVLLPGGRPSPQLVSIPACVAVSSVELELRIRGSHGLLASFTSCHVWACSC